MLPEFPNEVWMAVLGKLEDVWDFGRLQQVSRCYNAILADIGWTKLKGLECKQRYWEGDILISVEMESQKQKLCLPIEKQLLLLRQLTKKAANITDISLGIEPIPGQCHQFFGDALDILASGSQKIRSFHFLGRLSALAPTFPSLASFISAMSQTIQQIHIKDCDSCTDPAEVQAQIPPELLQAFRGCSQLQSVHLRCFRTFNAPLFESIIHGKTKLKSLDFYNFEFSIEPHMSAILDSPIRLLYFGCDIETLNKYAAELGRRGLTGTDQHPLVTVKELKSSYTYGPPPTFSLMPSLETLELECGEYQHLNDAVMSFLSTYERSPGSRKELMFVMDWHYSLSSWSGVRSGQQLAARFRPEFSCQATLQALGDEGSEIGFSRGNATIICRLKGLPLQVQEDEDEIGGDME